MGCFSAPLTASQTWSSSGEDLREMPRAALSVLLQGEDPGVYLHPGSHQKAVQAAHPGTAKLHSVLVLLLRSVSTRALVRCPPGLLPGGRPFFPGVSLLSSLHVCLENAMIFPSSLNEGLAGRQFQASQESRHFGAVASAFHHHGQEAHNRCSRSSGGRLSLRLGSFRTASFLLALTSATTAGPAPSLLFLTLRTCRTF